MAKRKIQSVKKDLFKPGELDPKKAMVRISLLIDGELLLAYKEAAKKTAHGQYQTLMKEMLREAVFGPTIDPRLKELIRSIVREENEKKAS